MPLQHNLVSVVIPAYNQPDYLRKAILSIAEQDYRPIEVIVSDDCSPLSLEPVVKELSAVQNELFTIRYFRSLRNLGVMDNFRFAVEQAQGGFLVPSAHDNRFISRSFFTDAVKTMSSRSDCHLCFGNAIYENNEREALHFPGFIKFSNSWSLMEGDDFIQLYSKGGIGWTPALVLDHKMALALNAYKEPYVISGALSRRLGIAQDDLFSYVFLLSGVGAVALCEKPVCEIGTPPESYSRSNRGWKDTRGKVKFVIFYNISRADLKGKYASQVKKNAFKRALYYADGIFDTRIAQYYSWRPEIIFLMGFSLLRKSWISTRYLFKRGVNVVRPNSFKKTKRN
jgi:glycosyltransferase involved in cell wall biosynthesis